jgi:hypothetical protein
VKKISFFLSLAFFIVNQSAIAQTKTEWLPVLISSDGTNGYEGVVATYTLTNCNARQILLLKLVNTNNYAIKAKWRNLIQTSDGRDLFGTGDPLLMTLTPNSETKGACENNFQLTINLNDFGIKEIDFKTFIASDFEVIKK